MEEKYSFQYTTIPKINIAAFREAVFEKHKLKTIILLIMFVIFLAMAVYDAFYPISGIWKIIYVILLGVPAAYVFMFRFDYDGVKLYYKENSGNTYNADIYENKVVLEKISQDDKPMEPIVIDLTDSKVIAKDRKNYLFIYCYPGYCVFPKEALSEADKQVLSSLAQRINAFHKEGKNKSPKTADRSGQ